MKSILSMSAMLLLALSVGCASSGDRKQKIINQAVSKIPPPQESFSNYGQFELKSMDMISEVREHKGKKAYADKLENLLEGKLNSLFTSWEKSGGKKIVVEPKIVGLRVVGSASRFFLGALGGQSNIELRLKITDAQTNKVIAQPVIDKQSNAFAGGWSVGATDKNLVNYISEIATEYFRSNYKDKNVE